LAWDLGIDQLLVGDPLSGRETAAPGRMAPATALNFFLLGLVLLLVNVTTRRRYRPTEVLTLTVTIISFLAGIGYAYGVEALYHIVAYSIEFITI
jgi:hypothetical protein